MITEIILEIFVITYYLFSVFLYAAIVRDVNKKYTHFQAFCLALEIIIIAPGAVPIMLGIKLGEWIRNN